MSLLDIDDNIETDETAFINILIDPLLFKDNYDYIYSYAASHYKLSCERDLISDEHIDDYWMLLKIYDDKLGISIYGHDKVIDIGYNIYIHDNIWECQVHRPRFIYDDIYYLNKSDKDFIIYSIDEEFFKHIEKRFENNKIL